MFVCLSVCLSVRYAFSPCNSYGYQTFHTTPLGPKEGRRGIFRFKYRFWRRVLRGFLENQGHFLQLLHESIEMLRFSEECDHSHLAFSSLRCLHVRDHLFYSKISLLRYLSSIHSRWNVRLSAML
jgi:hypothetical protein